MQASEVNLELRQQLSAAALAYEHLALDRSEEILEPLTNRVIKSNDEEEQIVLLVAQLLKARILFQRGALGAVWMLLEDLGERVLDDRALGLRRRQWVVLVGYAVAATNKPGRDATRDLELLAAHRDSDQLTRFRCYSIILATAVDEDDLVTVARASAVMGDGLLRAGAVRNREEAAMFHAAKSLRLARIGHVRDGSKALEECYAFEGPTPLTALRRLLALAVEQVAYADPREGSRIAETAGMRAAEAGYGAIANAALRLVEAEGYDRMLQTPLPEMVI